jgi:tetratricopeptide (TPR) repeat protein
MTLEEQFRYAARVTSTAWSSFPDDASAQRQMEKAVRSLLHRVRQPYRLSAAPVAKAICRAVGIANAVTALRTVVEEALPNENTSEGHLRAAILGVDFRERVSVREAAAGMQISRRHLQRHRAEAVATIAQHVRTLLGPIDPDVEVQAGPAPDAIANLNELAARSQLSRMRAEVESGCDITHAAFQTFPDIPPAVVRASIRFSREINGRPDDPALVAAECSERPVRCDVPIRFELEYIAFLRARASGRATEMRAIAESLARLSHADPSCLGIALNAQADAAFRLGRLAKARECLERGARLNFHRNDAQHFAAATILTARVELFNGNVQAAEELASAAYAVLHGFHRDEHQCQILIAQARLQRGLPWSMAPDAASLPPLSWDRLALEIETARHLASAGDWDAAEDRARIAHDRASSFGYEGLAARAAATVSACAAARADRPESRKWTAEALDRVLRTHDVMLAAHVMMPSDEASAEDRFDDLVERRIALFDDRDGMYALIDRALIARASSLA